MAVSRNWANLRSFLIQTYNQEVNAWFGDVANNEPDNDTPRNQARKACLIESTDSQNMASLKVQIFRYTVQRVHLRPDVFGIEATPYNEEVALKPQVILFFTQDSGEEIGGRRRVEGQMSMRLVTETSATMTKAKAQTIASNIRSLFAEPTKLVWKKGKIKVCYKDPELGLNLGILSLNKEEGISLVQKMVTLAQGQYDENLIRTINPDRESETDPQDTLLIYEKQRRKKRWRPEVNVKFRYALLTMSGLNHNIALVDTTFNYFSAYEFVKSS